MVTGSGICRGEFRVQILIERQSVCKTHVCLCLCCYAEQSLACTLNRGICVFTSKYTKLRLAAGLHLDSRKKGKDRKGVERTEWKGEEERGEGRKGGERKNLMAKSCVRYRYRSLVR